MKRSEEIRKGLVIAGALLLVAWLFRVSWEKPDIAQAREQVRAVENKIRLLEGEREYILDEMIREQVNKTGYIRRSITELPDRLRAVEQALSSARRDLALAKQIVASIESGDPNPPYRAVTE